MNSDLMLQYAINEFYDPYSYIPLGDYTNPKAPYLKYRKDIMVITYNNKNICFPSEKIFNLSDGTKSIDLMDMLQHGGKVIVSKQMKENIIETYPEHFL